jgi:hypothetical protein
MNPHRLGLTALPLALLCSAAVAQMQAFSQVSERKATRIAFFDFNSMATAGQATISWGPGKWNDDYDKTADQLKGKVERLGKDSWTTLDSFMEMTIGGTKIPAGLYYLGIGRSENGDWSLVLFDSAEIRKTKADAFMTGQIKAASLKVPLTYTKSEKKAEELEIAFTADKENLGKGKLALRWGNHQVSAEVNVDVKVAAGNKARSGQPQDAGVKPESGKK